MLDALSGVESAAVASAVVVAKIHFGGSVASA
jgi:hypothetical protein